MRIAETIREISIIAIPVLASLTFHEVAHGWVAYLLGDPTAKNMGRLTLNPIAHLDPVGTLVFAVTRMVGWAKPVPINPRNFKNPLKGMMWVAISGPTSNIVLALICALLFKLTRNTLNMNNAFIMLPIIKMLAVGVSINIALAMFNMLPIPPLDGWNVVKGLVPIENVIELEKLEPYGFLIIIIFIMSGAVDSTIVPIMRTVIGFLI
ncbi:MAG: site-2 protease family protein [Nitrospinae bacterium]|nr:site-2 protease family protein [Nitrospinota bacterium]